MADLVQCIVHALNVRATPDSSSPGNITGQLLMGQQATVDNYPATWLHMVAPHTGYFVSKSNGADTVQVVSSAPPPPTDTVQVRTTTALNVRSGPGTNYGVLLTLGANITVSVYAHVLVSASGYHWLQIASQTPQWIAQEYTTTGTTPVPAPQPQPVPPPSGSWQLPFDVRARGVHGNAGGWSPANGELALITRNQIKTIFIIAWQAGQASASIPRYKASGITQFLFRAQHSGLPQNAGDFVVRTLPTLHEYSVALGTTELIIQIANEPNITGEGYGSCWQNGGEFAAFWLSVAKAYRNALPGCRLGYPALSPGPTATGSMGSRADEKTFAQQSIAAIRAADWIGLHAYWTENDGGNFAPEIPYWRQFGKPIIGTEIGVVAPGVVTAQATLHAYGIMADAGIPCMSWVLNGTGSFQEADWTVHNLTL